MLGVGMRRAAILEHDHFVVAVVAVAHRRLYHGLSVLYSQDDWSLLAGVENLFDAEPPSLSTGAATRYGNIPAFATQYDLYGRTGYVRFNYKF